MARGRTATLVFLLVVVAAQTAGNLLPFVQDAPFADPEAPRDHATPWLSDARVRGLWFDERLDGHPGVDIVRGAALLLGLASALHALALGMAAGQREDWALGLCVPATLLLATGLGLDHWKLAEAARIQEPSLGPGFALLVTALLASLVTIALLAHRVRQSR